MQMIPISTCIKFFVYKQITVSYSETVKTDFD